MTKSPKRFIIMGCSRFFRSSTSSQIRVGGWGKRWTLRKPLYDLKKPYLRASSKDPQGQSPEDFIKADKLNVEPER